jgi:type II secretory pathway pseudopilin PulG
MAHIHNSHRRRAFTIVEMLVAAALILFMMWIIASAFQAGLESFRVLKAAGDMQEKLRAAATALRRDLTRPHFTETSARNGEDLSNQRLDDPLWTPPIDGYFRIYQQGVGDPDGLDSDDSSGTLIHYRSPKSNFSEPLGHVLQFTAKLKGIRRDQYYMVDTQDLGADVVLANPGGDGLLRRFNFPIYNRRVQYPLMNSTGTGLDTTTPVDGTSSIFTTVWAEVTYFVRPNGDSTGGVPLYNLYRRLNLLTTNLPETVNYASGSAQPLQFNQPYNDSRYLETSAWRKTTGMVPFNSQAMVTAPCRRFGVDPTDAAGQFKNMISLNSEIPRLFDQVGSNVNDPLAASDLMLTDVTDFSVKVVWDIPAATGTWVSQPPNPNNNPDYPFDRLPTSNNPSFADRVFDTWSQRIPPSAGLDDYGSPVGSPAWNVGYGTGTATAKSIPIKIRVRALQITLRIWDVKSKQSRQITIIQDM